MTTVNDLLKKKSGGACTIAPDATIFDALQLMAEKDIGALVVAQNGKVVGIFSERDYARKVILKGKSSRETTVSELMSTRVYCVKPDTSLEDCMELMTAKHIRHLPVVQDGLLTGVVSIGDAVNHVISKQKRHILDLESFITGRYEG